ncbi:hypothetical protein NQ318_018792 [Aromia moschata]|uniref:DUF4781 domain-containing protein n=1 Tax=Aromia moschata TaxID=1265417 RepID=A0AAV8ZGA5_9CUCU|nr:hypothetical protein NQ318_018792 [Aromia moschata]
MDMEENILTFFITYESRETTLQLAEYDTVGKQKSKNRDSQNFRCSSTCTNIGWLEKRPEDDNTILQMCAEEDITILNVRKYENHALLPAEEVNSSASHASNEGLQVEASMSFISKMLPKGIHSSITFHSCTLENALSQTCLAPLNQRKVLLLYLHNEEDSFSSIFCSHLRGREVAEILRRSFFLLGWDIGESKYQGALKAALERCDDLSNLVNMIQSRSAAALFIVPINDSLTVSSILRVDVSRENLLLTLTQSENFLNVESSQEEELQLLNEQAGTANDFGSESYQKLMADMLGDRDYDSFEYNQHKHLKKKIAFALAGPETSEKGYEKKFWKKPRDFTRDKVEISFIYNCTEPLPAEKIARAQKYKDYNPRTDLMPIPVFVVRKCHGSNNPCRIFVDDIGRTYETWQEYISRNKLHECQMILPRDGRYEVGRDGRVLLERHLSPACGVDTKVLAGADYVSTAGGLASGGVFLAAAIPSIAVAPAVLVGAGVVGLGVGVYSIGRSAYTLYDRSRHKETLSFANSEARGAYLNILAGSLGFVGAGANVAVSQLASRGVNIGQGARAVVNTIGITNIGVSGASVLNSGYDVLDQWINENQSPSWLTIVQLSSSVLFFGNAVYNFRSCSTIVEEAQTRTLQDYQESLRSNRHRKTFTKLLKETISQNNGNEASGRAEVISAIRNIQNKDEVFAVLTRSNKDMNRNGIKFSAIDGDIRLNGIKIDMNEFMSMNKKETKTLLMNLSSSEPSPVEARTMRTTVSSFHLDGTSVTDVNNIASYTLKLLYFCSGDVRTKVIGALASLLAKLTVDIKLGLDQLFPDHDKYFRLINLVVGFFSKLADELEEKYQMWKKTGDKQYHIMLFDYMEMDKAKRYVKLFEKAINMCYMGMNMTEEAIKRLLTHFHNWIATKVYEHQETKEREERRMIHSARSRTRRVHCAKCGGHYYVKA